jgi:hypothetical protein
MRRRRRRRSSRVMCVAWPGLAWLVFVDGVGIAHTPHRLLLRLPTRICATTCRPQQTASSSSVRRQRQSWQTSARSLRDPPPPTPVSHKAPRLTLAKVFAEGFGNDVGGLYKLWAGFEGAMARNYVAYLDGEPCTTMCLHCGRFAGGLHAGCV